MFCFADGVYNMRTYMCTVRSGKVQYSQLSPPPYAGHVFCWFWTKCRQCKRQNSYLLALSMAFSCLFFAPPPKKTKKSRKKCKKKAKKSKKRGEKKKACPFLCMKQLLAVIKSQDERKRAFSFCCPKGIQVFVFLGGRQSVMKVQRHEGHVQFILLNFLTKILIFCRGSVFR